MLRTEKVEVVASVEKVLREARGAYLINFTGMTVELISDLRSKCREANIRVEVVKNTLLRRAASSTGF